MSNKVQGRPIRCRECNNFLCVEAEPGLYVFSRSHGRNNRYRVELAVGAITCNKCGTRQAIPPIEALSPNENGGKDA